MTIDAHRFLSAIQQQLLDYVVPALGSEEDVAERASFSAILINRLIADRFIFPDIARQMHPRFAALAEEARYYLASQENDLTIGVGDLRATYAEHDPLGAVDALRAHLAQFVRALAPDHVTSGSGEPARLAALIVALDCEWRTACSAAQARAQNEQVAQRPAAKAASDAVAAITAEDHTAYLRGKFPEHPALVVDAVRVLSGGRSKDSYLLDIRNAGAWPPAIVMRQDTGRDTLLTSICDEYPAILGLASHDLAIPRPLMIEPHANPLGKPFFLMEKIEGTASGNYYTGLFEQDPVRRERILLDLAGLLGRLHAIDPRTILPDAPDHRDHLLQQLRHYRAQWRRCAPEPSPLIEQAFIWLEREVLAGIGDAAIVHGDVAVHNILVDDGRLAALLDWELVHVGDPAADLAYVRPVVESGLSWTAFMAAYRAAGGGDIDARRLRMFAVWGFIRNAAIAAGGGDRFRSDPGAPFELGFMGTATAFLEQQLVPLFAGESDGR